MKEDINDLEKSLGGKRTRVKKIFLPTIGLSMSFIFVRKIFVAPSQFEKNI